MKFSKVKGKAELAAALAESITNRLSEGSKVLWLVPGGSNIPVVVEAMSLVPVSLTDGLTIMLTDERYGLVGHADSNLSLLRKAGFDPGSAKSVRVLDGVGLDETVARYANLVEESFAAAEYRLGFFGMGADGHIAGILPGSPAVGSADPVCGFKADDFVRITLTPAAIINLDEAIVGAFGSKKVAALKKLRDEVLSAAEQPAQILKSIEKTVIFNDQIEGEAK